MNAKSPTRIVGGIGLLLLLSACTIPPKVPLTGEFWSQRDRSVAIAVAKLPDATAHNAGGMLLDTVINDAVMADLSKSLKSVNLSATYESAREEVTRRMQEKGVKAIPVRNVIDTTMLPRYGIEESPYYAFKDFRSLKAELGNADRLLLFTVEAAGTYQHYYGIIPLGAPKAMLRARGEIIDLATNELIWQDTITSMAEIDDPWDQTPDFPNVHAAVGKLIPAARNSMIDRLFASAPAATAAGR